MGKWMTSPKKNFSQEKKKEKTLVKK